MAEPIPLVIIGGGAAGLMGACRAGELGVPVMLLERKHRVGSKLLMCGNGRCNLTTDMPTQDMLGDFGDELSTYLFPAFRDFGPGELQQWFKRNGLPLMRTKDGKVFPKSERAPDVVHCFTDRLRDLAVPVALNVPVKGITTRNDGFVVSLEGYDLVGDNVLLATGGVSYPKTGSVGDGQKFARALGHRLQPYRPGLVGVKYDSPWLQANIGRQFKRATVRVFDGNVQLGRTAGLLECERWGLGGGAISNATRLLSRAKAERPTLEIRPDRSADPLRLDAVKMRPLKEAMVTVGGVDIEGVDPSTMESRAQPGLYLAGEVLDIDGPTGGYNLTAAFATARLAVEAIAKDLGVEPKPKPRPRAVRRGRGRTRRRGTA